MKLQNYYIGSFELVARIIGGLVGFPFIFSLFKVGEDLKSFEEPLRLFFYVFFLYSMEAILRSIRRSRGDERVILKTLSYMKWLMLFITILLIFITLKSYISVIDYSKIPGVGFSQKLNYHFKYAGPLLVVPNIGYIIITFLTFYISKVLLRHKELKEEQEFTI